MHCFSSACLSVREQQESSIVHLKNDALVLRTEIGRTPPSNGSVDRLIDVVVNGPTFYLHFLDLFVSYRFISVCLHSCIELFIIIMC